MLLPVELREVFDGPLDDPAGKRLFPAAYLDPTEEAAETEWKAMVHLISCGNDSTLALAAAAY